jgi:DNA-binding phage protein
MADQIAYLETCLSKDLAKYIARETTATTPIIGENSCFSLLDTYFNRKYPILLRRKNFFAMQQQAGQDERAFIEELQAVAEEADIASMSLEDSLCLMMLAGLTDKKLVEKLSEQEEPRFTSFKRVVDAHLHAKATGQGQAGTFKTTSADKKKGGNPRPSNPTTSQRREPSDREKKRRAALAGKCYRCGSSEHLGSGCSVKRDHICNRCKGK